MRQFSSILLFLFVFSTALNAQQVSLDSLVDLEFKNITIKRVLEEISEKYGINFSYSDSNIPVNNLIDVTYNSIALGELLRDLLHKNDINYSIIENQVVLFPISKNQTITIYGKVINQLDGSPIPFANISLSGTNKGTSSNEQGEFEIPLNKLPSELMISHLAHEKKLIYVYDDTEELEILLLPAQRTLDEITIRGRKNKNVYYNLIKKAYDRLAKFSAEKKYGKAFYRQKSQREGTYTEIFELFYDVKYSMNGIEDWAVQEGRYAFQNQNEYDIFLYNKNFTLLSRMFPIRQPDTESYIIPINPEVKKLYDLDLKDVIKFDERLIGIITYTPKPGIARPIAKGELYIDFENYQVLKMIGTITDESLDIIGFNDSKSAWDNYQLGFQVSFIDGHSDELLMDYIQIDHSFDYYYNQERIGKIKTSSLLTFYEHYIPANNKKLGGAIDYTSSDMKTIDALGYNPVFWSQNPIVKRTPLEEDLIRDFEQNEAFGVVFMNNEEQVVLLPDKKHSDQARQVIARYEKQHMTGSGQQLFLRLDKNQYQPADKLRFTAYVLDQWTLKPYALGSVLTLELYDLNNQLLQNKKYDISEGTAYGELTLSNITLPGLYKLKAYTNIDDGSAFEQNVRVAFEPAKTFDSPLFPEDIPDTQVTINFYPETETILQGVRSKIVFQAHSEDGIPINAQWFVFNDADELVLVTRTNRLGIGSIEMTPKGNTRYYLQPLDLSSEKKWLIPEAKSTGFAMQIDDNKSRSIHVELHQKPVLPREINLLFTSGGKVFSFYEKRMSGLRTRVELPKQHLPGGINTLIAMDQTGTVLGERSFFVQPNKLNIHLESSSWKSKRSNRIQLNFKVTDQNGKPVDANLSAVCSTEDISAYPGSDIRNYLYFGNDTALNEINLGMESDSLYTLIDDILIINESMNALPAHSVKSNRNTYEKDINTAMIQHMTEPVIAEVSISGNFSAQGISGKNKKIRNQSMQHLADNVYWIPSIGIDEYGNATVDYRMSRKSRTLYVNIQGVSKNGLVGYQSFWIDPYKIKNRK